MYIHTYIYIIRYLFFLVVPPIYCENVLMYFHLCLLILLLLLSDIHLTFIYVTKYYIGFSFC